MPKQNQPITRRTNAEKESVASTREHHGKHRENDEALPGRGSTKGGLNRSSGTGGRKQNSGLPKGNSSKTRGSRGSRS
jgi:hypothetical protein